MATSNPKVGLPPGDKVITYIFDKSYYPNIKDIKKWLSLWGSSHSKIKETENNYRIKQDDTGNYELGTLRTIDIADGICAVVGKIKTFRNPDMQYNIYKDNSSGAWIVQFRQYPSNKWHTVYSGGSEKEAKEIYKNMRKKKRNSAVRLNNPLVRPKHHMKRAAYVLAQKGRDIIDIAHDLPEEIRTNVNPQHFPKTKAGRPRKRGRPSKAKGKIFSSGRKPKILYWVLDLYKQDTLLTTLIGQGTKEQASSEAKGMIGRHIKHKTVTKAMLSGPYYFKPSKEVVRK